MATSTGLTLPQFVTALMRELRMADHPTPLQLQLLAFMEDKAKRKILCAFRGLGKSTLAAMYGLWALDRNPNEKILFLSASGDRANSLAEWCFNAIHTVPWLAHMRPDTRDGRYSKIRFDVGSCSHIEQSPSIRAAGIYGQITGSRASLIIPDDVETPTTALTQVQREKLRNVLNELEAILKPGPQSRILFLGTPHNTTDSIYFHLRRTMGYAMRMWPARVPDGVVVYNGCLAKTIAAQVGERKGKPTDTRFGETELVERQQSMSPMQWRLQFMLDPTLSDLERYPLRCADLMVMTVDDTLPEVLRYEKTRHQKLADLPCPGMAHDASWYSPVETSGAIPVGEAPCVMAIDPSGGGADEFAWAIVRVWNGNYFLVRSGGRRGGVSEALWRQLAEEAKQYGVNEILVETNFGGLEIYSQVLKPYLMRVDHGCHFEPVRSNIQKERRIIDTLAPLLQTHRMVVDRRVVEADYQIVEGAVDDSDLSYSLFYQLTRLTHDKGSLLHDDRLDAWAMACAWFQEQAALDQRIRQSERRQEMLEAMLADEADGDCLLNATRLGMGMTLEQAKRAASMDGGPGWLRRTPGSASPALRARPGRGRGL